jgi:hypothetical protein
MILVAMICVKLAVIGAEIRHQLEKASAPPIARRYPQRCYLRLQGGSCDASDILESHYTGIRARKQTHMTVALGISPDLSFFNGGTGTGAPCPAVRGGGKGTPERGGGRGTLRDAVSGDAVVVVAPLLSGSGAAGVRALKETVLFC